MLQGTIHERCLDDREGDDEREFNIIEMGIADQNGLLEQALGLFQRCGARNRW